MGVRPLAVLVAVLGAAVLAVPAEASPVLVVDSGSVKRVDDPALPPPSASDPLPADARRCSSGQSGPPVAHAAVVSVRKALRRAYASGAIDFQAYSAYADVYSQAKHASRRVHGRSRAELGSVIASVNRLAATGQLTASRLAPVFLELQRNTEWWTRTSRAPAPSPPLSGPRQPGQPWGQ